MNVALAAGGHYEAGNGARASVYLDFIDSDVANARAFRGPQRCYIGITLPLVARMSRLARQIAASDTVVSAIGLPVETDREALEGIAFWMLLSFIASHEYAHHDHGHLTRPTSHGASVGRLWRQAQEADADGWAAYLVLNQDFRPDIRDAVGASYFGLMDAVWPVACPSAETRGGWLEASGFLKTPSGAAYCEALVKEISLFRRIVLQED